MRRREFIMLVGGAAVTWPLAATAEHAAKIPRVVFFSPIDLPARTIAIRAQLRELGYLEGHTIRLEFRDAGGDVDKLPALAEELVREGDVDVFVTVTGPASAAAYRATKTIPIVAFVAGDPVAFGLAQSLAHPGGNVTGVAVLAEETSVKRVELLREVAPRAVRLAVAVTKVAQSVRILGPIQETGPKLGFTVEIIRIDDPADLANALRPEVLAGFDALMFPPDAILDSRKADVIKLINPGNKPAIFSQPEWADSGGLIAFGPDFADAARHQIEQLDRVLKGEKPADLPFDRSTRFQLTVNLLTAHAMGIELPPALLARADRVVE
ncbi:MAG TPA: ABC transporter substrate-binding protein [Bradyrhizobium sp.]|jgi:putative ABC transport system substrate-binding protein|nr:ABC transporter substrate-binding protein [Bradyrhizobium sp.]